MARHCIKCGKKCQGEYCFQHKPRKPLQTRTPMPRPTKSIAPVGKIQKATNAYVEAWKRKQKPDHQGYYTCYISGQRVPYLMAEHPYSKTRHPDKRTNQKLEPVSAEINKLKGSMDIDDFLHKYPQYMTTVKAEYRPKQTCLNCGKQMTMVYDSIAKAYTGYLWRCTCMPRGAVVSIG